jgi:hypothetical protein
VERTYLTLTLTQSWSSHESPSLHLSREPPVSGLCCTALAVAFPFSVINLPVCAQSVSHELISKPIKDKNLHHWPITTLSKPFLIPGWSGMRDEGSIEGLFSVTM